MCELLTRKQFGNHLPERDRDIIFLNHKCGLQQIKNKVPISVYNDALYI